MASRARRRRLLERARKDPLFREAVKVRDMARHIAYGRVPRATRRAIAAGAPEGPDADFFTKLRESWRHTLEATR